MHRLRSTSPLMFLVAAAILLSSLLLIGAPSRAQSDQSVLASLISRLLSTPTTRISIGSVEGALTSNAVIRDLRISDRDGVWLSVDRARLVWSRAALLRGRLQIDTLEVDRVDLSRRPEPGDDVASTVSNEPILPELPVKVVVGRFALGELVLGEPVLGAAARLSAEGSASLGAPSEGLDLSFRANRLDASGRFALGLGYVPKSGHLRIDLVHDEPAVGLAARLLDLPGLPPVALRVNGDGLLADFAARVNLVAGPTIGAQGEARISRSGSAYRATLGLAAQIAGLLPETAAPVFAGTTRLDGDVTIDDTGRIGLREVRLASQVATLELTGTVASDWDLDLKVTGDAVPNAGGSVRAGNVEIDTLDIDLSVQGSPTAPRLRGTLAAAGLKLPQGSVSNLNARIDTAPVTSTLPANQFRLVSEVTVTGLSLVDKALGRALGERVSVKARGTLDLAGVANIEEALIETPTASASFTGHLGAATTTGTLRARLPSLVPLSDLAGRGLGGSAEFEAELSEQPAGPTMARVVGRVEDFESDGTILNGLLGRSFALSGLVRRLSDGFSVEGLRLAAANLEAVLDGQATRAASDLKLRMVIPEIRQLDPRISAGQALIEARLTGSRERPDAVATVTFQGVRALDRSIPRLVVELKGHDLTGALQASLLLNGDVAGKRAVGSLDLVRSAEGSLLLDRLDLSVGSVSLKGRLTLSPHGLAQGDVALAAGDLDDVSPLVLTRLGGSVDATVALSSDGGAQAATVAADGSRLQVGQARLSNVKVAITGRDLLHAPIIDGRIEASALTLGSETFRSVQLTADGTANATRFGFIATAQGLALEAAGRLVSTSERRQVELTAFEARRGSKRIVLAAPAKIVFAPDAARITDLTLLANNGRIIISGQVGRALNLSVEAARIPLSVAEIFVPGFGLEGMLDGRATLQGSLARLTGSYEVNLTGLSALASRNAGLRTINLRAEGKLAEDRASVQATLTATQAGQLKIAGSVPLTKEGALDLAVAGQMDLGVLNAFLSAAGQRAAGAADLDLRVRGTVHAPHADGGVTLRAGTFEDPIQGLRLTGLEGRLVARGTLLTLERLTAHTPNAGSLTATGSISVDPAAGFPGTIRIKGTRAQLVSNGTATAVADLDLALQGPLLRRPRISGQVDLATLDVTVPDRLPVTLRPLPGTKHVQPPVASAARLAVARQRQAPNARASSFEAELDLTVSAQNRVFVRGRGIDAELGGKLRLTGPSRAPVAIGAFEMRRGQLDILGQRLSFSRGRVDFKGDLVPSLDFLAETRSGSITARIAVSGPASSPDFLITSDPDLPQDEVLSRILFQRAAGGLSPGQAIQLAQAVATLSGGSGTGAFEQIRRSLGVDSLDISTSASGGAAVGASRYISDRVKVGVRAGAKPEESAVSLDIDITRRLKAQGEVGADGRSSVGLGVEWEY